jgi:hypothetical protein
MYSRLVRAARKINAGSSNKTFPRMLKRNSQKYPGILISCGPQDEQATQSRKQHSRTTYQTQKTY